MKGENYFRSTAHNWRIAFTNSKFRLLFISGMILLGILIYAFNVFFQWAQQRQGVVMNDWLLNQFTPRDLSLPVSLLINLLTTIALVMIIKNPVLFLQTLYAYLLLSTCRLVTIYLIPLEPPTGIIELRDPFLEIVAYGEKTITKDLFFSGHISTLLLMWIAAEQRWLKRILLISTLFVAVGILIMRVHYTVDILAAPLFVFLSWKLSKVFLERVGNRLSQII